MDPHGGVERWCLLAKKSLHFLALLSLFSFLYSNDLHFSSFAHSVDRKYMFLICHLILAFLLKQMPPILLPEYVASATVEYAVSPVAEEEEGEETEQHHEHGYGDMMAEDEVDDGEMTADDQVEEDQEDNGGDGEMMAEDELEEDEDEKLGASAAEEVSDARVSTEELNQKCEEFIRKMKEEIRITAHEQ